MQVDVAIIGGTGVGDRLLKLGGKAFHVPTSRGLLRGRRIEHEGVGILLVSRHSVGHKVAPHKVNYGAIVLGLKDRGVKGCFASAAVGSLRREWPAGTLVACDDFLDFTYRNATLHDERVVHTDFSSPFPARTTLLQAAQDLNLPIEDGGVYVCLNGPRYETPREIQVYSQVGGDVVGMTAATEAVLMREAGVAYACLAVVTNAAAGFSDQPLSHDEVVAEMQKSGEKAVQILLRAAVRQAQGQ